MFNEIYKFFLTYPPSSHSTHSLNVSNCGINLWVRKNASMCLESSVNNKGLCLAGFHNLVANS